MNRIFGLTDAIISLAPGSQWVLTGDEYSGLEWISEDVSKPTEDELLTEVSRLQSEYDALEYQRLRASEYPDMADYIDGIVKGDQEQVDAYVAACLAVKAKYPKP
jgi:tRNA A37 N6-isopentenylltransferase MiaA